MLQLPTFDPGEDLAVSASSFVLWQQCPQEALERFGGVYGADSVPAFRGSLAHAVFAKHLVDGPIPTETFTQTCKQAIGGSNLNFKVKSLNLKPSQIRSVIEEVGGLYDRFKKMPPDDFEDAERLIKVHLGEGVTLSGRIDAVYRTDGGVRLVDWKTGDIGDVEIQLKFYAMLWALEQDELPSEIEAFSVRTGEHELFTPTVGVLNELLDRVELMVSEVRQAWASGTELERRAGPWCQYCPLLASCAEGLTSQQYLG